jgi:hypothetical protein
MRVRRFIHRQGAGNKSRDKWVINGSPIRAGVTAACHFVFSCYCVGTNRHQFILLGHIAQGTTFENPSGSCWADGLLCPERL